MEVIIWGLLQRLDHRTGESRAINVWPVDNMGAGAEAAKYRFQWNFPIFFSPNNPKKLYAAGNHLFVTEDEGKTWQMISPDLTTNDKKKQASSGGPITQDNTQCGILLHHIYCNRKLARKRFTLDRQR